MSSTELTIVATPVDDLSRYCSIPISFVGRSRLDVNSLREGRWVEIPVEEFAKDYDALEPPTRLVEQFETSSWTMITAERAGDLAGGAIVAWGSEGFDMLQNNLELAVLADLRVAAHLRGEGIGTRLFAAACHWATSRGCSTLHVETQDTNVAACGFYRARGCQLDRIEIGAYGPNCDEAKIVWSICLTTM